MRYFSDRLSRPGRAFTLVELLVVVAIIAVLMALLLPSLAAARAQAQAAKCAANMRSIGSLANLYAAERDGRLPNGVRGHYAPDPSISRGADFFGVLNVEMLRTPTAWPSARDNFPHIWPHRRPYPWSMSARTKALTCWSYEPSPPNAVTICFMQARDAEGGVHSNGSPPDPIGPYGAQADDNMVREIAELYLNTNDKIAVDAYYLGTKLAQFNGSYQIMVFECNGSNGVQRWSVSDANGATWAKDPGGETWRGGTFAFRHPRGQGGNFLFYDAHVERLPPVWRQVCTRERINLN